MVFKKVLAKERRVFRTAIIKTRTRIFKMDKKDGLIKETEMSRLKLKKLNLTNGKMAADFPKAKYYANQARAL